jgi:hypothetical protein
VAGVLLDPLHQWDHRSEKVTEHENGAIALLVSILLLSLLVAILPWSELWWKFFSDPLHCQDSSRLQKVSKYNTL